MITLFTIPKSFDGHTGVIQRNAIRSWLNAAGISEIILFGNDPGVAEVAAEFKLTHVPNIETNEFGTPLLSDAFYYAQKESLNKTLLYINSDIIIPSDFCRVLNIINFPQFIVSGRRLDVDVVEEFQSFGLEDCSYFFGTAKRSGRLHGYAGMDYFIFPRGQIHMPRFAVGRPGWDSWLIWKSKKSDIPVIDATEEILVVHQNHDYSHSQFGTKTRVSGPEFDINVRVAGGRDNMMTLRDADWIIRGARIRRPRLARQILLWLTSTPLLRLIIGVKRRIQDNFYVR